MLIHAIRLESIIFAISICVHKREILVKHVFRIAQNSSLRLRISTSSPQAPATSAPLIDCLEDSKFHLKHGKDKSLTQKYQHTLHNQYTQYKTIKPEIKITPQKANIQLHQNSPPKENNK